jgi:hypothetical protein
MKNKKGQIQPVAMQPSTVDSPKAVVPVGSQIQEQPQKKFKKWLWIILATIVAISVIGIIIWLVFVGGEGSVVGSGFGSSAPTPPGFPS